MLDDGIQRSLQSFGVKAFVDKQSGTDVIDWRVRQRLFQIPDILLTE